MEWRSRVINTACPYEKSLMALPGYIKSAVLLTVMLLSLMLPAQAALLCSYGGPDTSGIYPELSDFKVTGPEPLRVGDTATVSFTLKAIEFPVQFGDQGVFVAARDPDGMDRSFGRDIGHRYGNYWLIAGNSIDFKASTTVDKEGEWIFLPAYSSRTYEEDIVHTACPVESDYANHEIGEYLAVRHFGTKYMAINGKPNVLSPILVEMGEDEKHTMATGEVWDLGYGYYLAVEQIDLKGGKIWLSIQRYGKELESGIIRPQNSGDVFYNRMSITGFPLAYEIATDDVPTKSTFVYQEDIGHEGDVPIFSVYVDKIFYGVDANMVQLKYAILIDDHLTIINAGPDYACHLDVVSPAQPDLTVEDISWGPTHPGMNESVIVGVSVRNAGGASEETALLLGGCCDLSHQVRPLRSGEVATVYFEPITFGEPGEFEITATIDAAGKITESNETNNEISEIITVEGVLSPLSVSIFTDPVPSGESNEVAVRVTADGDPVQNASISLITTTGDLDPDAGSTDKDGRFFSIFAAPAVHMETRYTIHAEAEIGDLTGEGSASDLITVPLEIPPTAHIETPHDPAEEDGGEDGGGEVIVQTNVSSLSEYISKHISDPAVLAAMIAALAAGALSIYRSARNRRGTKNKSNKTGSIHATSNPSDAVVFVDMRYNGRSPKTVDNVLIGPHNVLFLKLGYFGYERGAVVIANQTTPVHCDLTKMPEVKLKLSADPAEIVAGRESRSMIKIELLTKDDNEIPIPVPNDTTVILATDIGAIESPVKIPRGRASVMSTLISTSSASRGTATVKAEAEYGKIVKLKGSTTVEFLDAKSE
ncbi:MAG: hypothetical protein C4B59_02265 [Candidatus Methanogaster sp.]|uniref:Uncharacterized protein n=1 Tax=Candidatus Methanogaster sp. TaxID=3386292 RepID=A0AC61L5T1_9EURY|nr:MAG: hypothetical protein C4B59_02265 [ANME-2 cluster archaeon]